jgi:hypothetical protein
MKKSFALGMIGLAALAGSAQAVDTVRARFDSIAPGVLLEYSIDTGGSFQHSFAGQFNWTRDNVMPGTYAGLQGQFATFCIEITQRVDFNNTYDFFVDTVSSSPIGAPMGAAKAGQLAELFGRFFGGLSSNDQYAAFQIAIWEITTDNATDVTSGLFQIRNNAVVSGLANSFLAALNGQGPTMNLLALQSRTAQDQIFVPAPGALALAGLGGLLAARRKR